MREKIKLESSAGTGHFYTTTKNKRTMSNKMEIKSLILLYVNMYCIKKQKLNNA